MDNNERFDAAVRMAELDRIRIEEVDYIEIPQPKDHSLILFNLSKSKRVGQESKRPAA